MKTILKKPIVFTVITALCLSVLVLFAASGCNKTEILPQYYTVTFAGEEIDIDSQSIIHGNYVIVPQNPEREGYNFGGWFTDNGTFVIGWDFKTDIITQDTTLYAKWEENTMQDYPIEISFEEYSLAGTSCQWTNLYYNGRLIVINSNEELENYISCSEGNYPEIDFSKYTLLLAKGTTPNGILEMGTRLLQLSTDEYKLDIEIFLNDAELVQSWVVNILVNKLSKKSDVELTTILKY